MISLLKFSAVTVTAKFVKKKPKNKVYVILSGKENGDMIP